MSNSILYSFFLLLTLFSFRSWGLDPQCKQYINLESYFTKNSRVESFEARDKTYKLDKITQDLSREVQGLQTEEKPNESRVKCLNTLLNEGLNDSASYWANRISKNGCIIDGDIPPQRPNDCPSNIWNEYHSSASNIDSNLQKFNAVQEKISTIADSTSENCDNNHHTPSQNDLASVKSTTCCDEVQGSAFNVLKTFYTTEFGNLSSKELKKECLLRTLDSGKTGTLKVAFDCVGSFVKGMIESLRKWLGTARSLLDFSTLVQLKKLLWDYDLDFIKRKLVDIFNEMKTQIYSQFEASFSCFTPYYAGQNICKLSGSILLDFIAGAGASKGLQILTKALTSAPGKIAGAVKEILQSSPKGRNVLSKLAPINKLATDIDIKTTLKVGTKLYVQGAKETLQTWIKKGILTPVKNFNSLVKKSLNKIKLAGKKSANLTSSKSSSVAGRAVANTTGEVKNTFRSRFPSQSPRPKPKISVKTIKEAKTVIGEVSSKAKADSKISSRVTRLTKSRINIAQVNDIKPTRKFLNSKNVDANWKPLADKIKNLQQSVLESQGDANAVKKAFGVNQSTEQISQQARNFHKQIDDFFSNGAINRNQANSLHHIVAVSEKTATNQATRPEFLYDYVVTPNTNPGTFSHTSNPSFLESTKNWVEKYAPGPTGTIVGQSESYKQNDVSLNSADTIKNAESEILPFIANSEIDRKAVEKLFQNLSDESQVKLLYEKLVTKINVLRNSKRGLSILEKLDLDNLEKAIEEIAEKSFERIDTDFSPEDIPI